MKIGVVSNFILPGFEAGSEIDLDQPTITLRALLEELSSRSGGRVKFIRPNTGAVDSMDFSIEVNGLINQGTKEDLNIALKEGDIVTIKLSPLGGG